MENEMKLKNLLPEESDAIKDQRYGLAKQDLLKLGKWFREKMSKNTVFPNPGYINKFYPDAFGDIEEYKKYAEKQTKETEKRYKNTNRPLPKENIYDIKGKYFWYRGRQ